MFLAPVLHAVIADGLVRQEIWAVTVRVIVKVVAA